MKSMIFMKDSNPALPSECSWRDQRFQTSKRMFSGPVDAVPLLDVVLILVMFVIMTSSFVLQPGIVVDLPAAPFHSGAKHGDLVVTISQEGFIFFNDELTTLEGLSSSLLNAARMRSSDMLVIEADAAVAHKTLVEIYNMAVKAGLKRVALATRMAPGT